MNAVRILMAVFIALTFASVGWAGEIDLPQSGQTTSYAAGDDGDKKTGVACQFRGLQWEQAQRLIVLQTTSQA